MSFNSKMIFKEFRDKYPSFRSSRSISSVKKMFDSNSFSSKYENKLENFNDFQFQRLSDSYFDEDPDEEENLYIQKIKKEITKESEEIEESAPSDFPYCNNQLIKELKLNLINESKFSLNENKIINKKEELSIINNVKNHENMENANIFNNSNANFIYNANNMYSNEYESIYNSNIQFSQPEICNLKGDENLRKNSTFSANKLQNKKCAEKCEIKNVSSSKFINTLYHILQSDEFWMRGIISWTDDGTAIEISSKQELEQKILPLYFKHGKYSNFVRQLNIYNFKKFQKKLSSNQRYLENKNTVLYYNPYFIRENELLIRKIQRKKIPNYLLQKFSIFNDSCKMRKEVKEDSTNSASNLSSNSNLLKKKKSLDYSLFSNLSIKDNEKCHYLNFFYEKLNILNQRIEEIGNKIEGFLSLNEQQLNTE